MVQIWGQSDLNSIFSIFYKNGTLEALLMRNPCPVHEKEHMVVILTFLAFFWYIMSPFQVLEL